MSTLRCTHCLLLVVVLTFTVGCARQLDANLAQRFEQAQQTFDQAKSPADFLRAASLYQEIIDRGVTSGGLLYNQGNAFLRGGEKGRAIAAYRQALRYLPRDPYLQANLQYALGDSQPAAKPLPEQLLFWQNWLSYPSKFYLLAALTAVAVTLGSAALFATRRRLWARLAIAAALMAGVMAVSAGYDWYRFEQLQHGVVISESVTARKGNSERYEPVFTEPLTAGTEFTVLEQRGSWYQVQLSHGANAWLPANDVIVY